MLRQISYFSDLDDEALALLLEKMQPADFRPAEVVCREGDPGEKMYIIDAGELSVMKAGEDGVPVEITVLRAGDIAGEMSLFGQRTRSATLAAKKETKVWVLGHDTFHQMFDEHPPLAKAVLTALTRHLSRQSAVVARLLTKGMDRRLQIAFYDAKPYMEKAFKEHNRFNYKILFCEARLTLETVSLAAGSKAVCVFVNDTVDEPVIRELKAMGVELIALRCAGFNNVDLKAAADCGIPVVRVPAYSPYAVAEHAAALMMTLNRRVHRANNRVREGNFSLDGLVGFDLHGKTAGIIGTGKIGQRLISILAGFGCSLLGYDKFPNEALAKQTGLRYVELDDLLARSDIISLHAPLLPDTFHLVNAAAIEKMKPGVMLINTSRGALIDTQALLDGLKSGKIGYAGLDVYEEEQAYFFEDFSDKVMTDDLLARLTTFNNVVITSHQGFLTRDALANIAETTLGNIRAHEKGVPAGELPNLVKSGA